MLGARLATAAVAIPILLAIIFAAPPVGMAILIFSLGTIAIAEYMGMAFPKGGADRWLGTACGTAVLLVAVASPRPGMAISAAIAAALAVLLVSVVARSEDLTDGLQHGALSFLGIIYVVILAHFVWLRHLDDGPFWITFVVANGMASDTGAYFAGKAFGRHKLLPRVSPGKTVEGAVGNLVAAALVGGLAWWLFFPDASASGLVLLAVVLAAVGQAGDLCESAIKRAFGSKESGGIFPGHGGVLDRIDSLLFPVAILYYYRALS
jgi:phosphatidate cytidylyltransferase